MTCRYLGDDGYVLKQNSANEGRYPLVCNNHLHHRNVEVFLE